MPLVRWMACALLCLPIAALANIDLVKGRSSKHCIYHAPDAPSSVRLAAEELKQYVAKATGVVLAVLNRASPPACPLISLGENAATRAAGFGLNALSLEGYLIATRGDNLYIVGPDTPDGQRTKQGGVSTGTLNGVYTFLEDYVGVRWLMPGEIGEHVPNRDRIVVPDLNRTDAPAFASRRLEYVQNDHPLVKEWLRRQKQGYSLYLRHGHSWSYVIPASAYEQHPDWFPMLNGVRPPPVGDRYKLETTNPGLVQAFAEKIIDEFNKRPEIYTTSISPTDSGDWSASPESKILYDKDFQGQKSVTPLVLDFYSKVARTVGRVAPDRKVCGYIYSDYLYPPSSGVPRLESNLCLVLAPHISYGYGLYRPSSRADWEQLMRVWPRAAGVLAYYDLPVSFVQSVGAPNPPGIDLLKFIYPQVASAGVQGVYIYGVGAWGHGAITNYLLAKLNWNPRADVGALARDFLRTAYGNEAAPHMQQLYTVLDEATRAHFESTAEKDHVLTRKILQGIYVPQLERIETLYSDALAAQSTAVEKARLRLFQINLHGFHRYLQNEGLVSKQRESVFSRDVSTELLLSPTGKPYDVSFAVSPIDKRSIAINPVTAQRAPGAVTQPRPVSPYLLRGKVRAVLFAEHDGEASIKLTRLTTRGDQVRCYLHDAKGKLLVESIMVDGETLRFNARQGHVYYLHVLADGASFGLEVKGAAYALDSRIQEKGLHFLADYTPVYFHVPGGFGEFAVTLSGWRSDGLNAAADIIAPDGRIAGTVDLRKSLAQRAKLVGDARGGLWTVLLRKPNLVGGDDLWVSVDERLSPWLVLDPKDPVLVEYRK